MPALAVNRNANRIRIRVVDARGDCDHPRGEFVADVQGYSHVRLGKAREQAVVDHAFGPADGLFGGLANQHQGSVPGILAVRHDFGRAHERGHVQIVPAGVHHGDVAPGFVFCMHFAGVGESGFFFHGQSVQFGAQHDGRSSPILEDGDYSGAANMFSHIVAGTAQAGS